MIPRRSERQERAIAGLLAYGSGLATGVITLGLILGIAHWDSGFAGAISGRAIVKCGIALFISLPIARVGLMFALFLRERDYPYVAISAFVLAIIAIGIAVEL